MPGNRVTMHGRVVPKAPCSDQLLPLASCPSPFLLPPCTPTEEEHLVLQPTISAPACDLAQVRLLPSPNSGAFPGVPQPELPAEVLITLHSHLFYPGLVNIWCE